NNGARATRAIAHLTRIIHAPARFRTLLSRFRREFFSNARPPLRYRRWGPDAMASWCIPGVACGHMPPRICEIRGDYYGAGVIQAKATPPKADKSLAGFGGEIPETASGAGAPWTKAGWTATAPRSSAAMIAWPNSFRYSIDCCFCRRGCGAAPSKA